MPLKAEKYLLGFFEHLLTYSKFCEIVAISGANTTERLYLRASN